MKIGVEYLHQMPLPLLTLYIDSAPGIRVHRAVLQAYRMELIRALSGHIHIPISYNLDLKVRFIDPETPDLDNLIMSLYTALDGKSLKKPGILVDDRLIQGLDVKKIYVHTNAPPLEAK